MVENKRIIGPFSQLLTMRGLPLAGPVNDSQLEIIKDGAILLSNGIIEKVGQYANLITQYPEIEKEHIPTPSVVLPGFIDAHTHLCFAGTRAGDYAMRISGIPYLDIAKKGGGILSSVKSTRNASPEELYQGLNKRCDTQIKNGVTSCEVKSGYGLTVKDELKMLRNIQQVNTSHPLSLIPTCLAAHTCPPEFDNAKDYLEMIVFDLLPIVKSEQLSKRVDIFVEESAFTENEARQYISMVKDLGFEITIHADQFSTSGSKLATEFDAVSADHLEVSSEKQIALLAKHNIPGILLPGASIGLGMNYPKGRKMLDANMSIAIASDWNPGSAPMGDLLTQAAIFGAYEHFSTAETFAAITYRAANALRCHDRGQLSKGMKADFIAFPCNDYREILYHQGTLKPDMVWIGGEERMRW